MTREDGAEPRCIPVLGCKPLIGVVHLPPLIRGGKAREPEQLIDYAVSEARKLEEAGFDAVIVENYGDKPYAIEWRDPLIYALISVVTREVARSTSLTVGVNILRNDPASVPVAYSAGASFVRVNSLCEHRLAVEGMLTPIAKALTDHLARLPRALAVLADYEVKHSIPLSQQEEPQLLRDCVERAAPTAIVVTGAATGKPPSPGYLASIRALTELPIVLGSGVSQENVRAYVALADGVIVGSSIKMGPTESPIDPVRARRLAEAWREAVKQRGAGKP